MNPWLKKIIPEAVKAPLRRLRKTPAKSVSENYFERRERVISEILSNPQLLELFSRLQKLPVGYGRLLDERVVEYPWLFARLQACRARTLDVGSTLNFDYLYNQMFKGYHDMHDLNGPGPVDSKFPIASQAVALLEMWMPSKS